MFVVSPVDAMQKVSLWYKFRNPWTTRPQVAMFVQEMNVYQIVIIQVLFGVDNNDLFSYNMPNKPSFSNL